MSIKESNHDGKEQQNEDHPLKKGQHLNLSNDSTSSSSSIGKPGHTLLSLLQNISPQEFAQYLVTYRFSHDLEAAVEFLLLTIDACSPNMQEILSSNLLAPYTTTTTATTTTTSTLTGSKNKEIKDRISIHLGNPILSMEDWITAVSPPREKFQITLYPHGITLTRCPPNDSPVLQNNKKKDTNRTDIYILVSSNFPSLSLLSSSLLSDLRSSSPTVEILSVEYGIFFPKPEDCLTTHSWKKKKRPKIPSDANNNNSSNDDRKEEETQEIPGSMVLFTFASSPMNSSLSQVCFQLPSFTKTPNNTTQEEEIWRTRVQSSFPHLSFFHIHSPWTSTVSSSTFSMSSCSTNQKYQFSSEKNHTYSTTTSSMPFVKCYHHLKDGVLYPMEEGLLFFKPPLFIHRSRFYSISCGRGTSSSSSRYMDMILHLVPTPEHSQENENGMEAKKKKKKSLINQETIEFSNIDRGEIHVLNDYIHNVLIKAMQKDRIVGEANGNGKQEEEENRMQDRGVVRKDMTRYEEENDDDDSDDDDYHEDSQDEKEDEEGEDEDEEDFDSLETEDEDDIDDDSSTTVSDTSNDSGKKPVSKRVKR